MDVKTIEKKWNRVSKDIEYYESEEEDYIFGDDDEVDDWDCEMNGEEKEDSQKRSEEDLENHIKTDLKKCHGFSKIFGMDVVKSKKFKSAAFYLFIFIWCCHVIENIYPVN